MIHSTWLLTLLTVLAVARGTRLVNEDIIFDTPRNWLLDRAPDSKVAVFVTCPWCVSIWVGGVGAVLVYFWHREPVIQIGLLALASSQLTGLLALLVNVFEKAASD